MKTEDKAITYAHSVIRRKLRENPCYLCEQVDCEECEYFGTRIIKEGGIIKVDKERRAR